MFSFFLNSYRHNLLRFSGGEDFKVEFDKNGPDAKFCFRLFEDGRFKSEDGNTPVVIKTRHPNLVYGAIKGKKSWGLWTKEWSRGIADWTFTKEEILDEFKKFKIEMPEAFLKEFENAIRREKKIVLDREIERLSSGGMWK